MKNSVKNTCMVLYLRGLTNKEIENTCAQVWCDRFCLSVPFITLLLTRAIISSSL